MKIKTIHADHSIEVSILLWGVDQINTIGFFIRTLELPNHHPSLLNALYGPRSGDPPINDVEIFFVQRSADRPPSRMIAQPKRPTRLLTIIGINEGSEATIFTAYGGPAAEREPGDVTLKTDEEKKTAADFWAVHALSWES